MKTLYKFKITIPKEKEVPHEAVDEKGQKVVTYSKEQVPEIREYAILKPSRDLRDECDFFHAQQKSLLIKSGVLTQAQLSKYLSDGGGIVSEKESEMLDKEVVELKELMDRLNA